MGRAWVKARRKDPYYRAAKDQDLRSRAVFKLVQANERFDLIRAGDIVLDLGAAPGGWSRAAAELAGPKGRVVAVDRVRMAPLDRVTFLRGDFAEPETEVRILEALGTPADVVLCDAAPRLTGVRAVDVPRSLDLAGSALRLARKALRPGGRFVAKVFQGDGYPEFLREVSGAFESAKGYVPPATTKESAEIYVVGISFIGDGQGPRRFPARPRSS